MHADADPHILPLLPHCSCTSVCPTVTSPSHPQSNLHPVNTCSCICKCLAFCAGGMALCPSSFFQCRPLSNFSPRSAVTAFRVRHWSCPNACKICRTCSQQASAHGCVHLLLDGWEMGPVWVWEGVHHPALGGDTSKICPSAVRLKLVNSSPVVTYRKWTALMHGLVHISISASARTCNSELLCCVSVRSSVSAFYSPSLAMLPRAASRSATPSCTPARSSARSCGQQTSCPWSSLPLRPAPHPSALSM